MTEKYDYVVIGSGPAGHSSAIKAAQLGLKTCVIEKDPSMLGGVCLNEGCIPAKSLYHSASAVLSSVANADLLGLYPENIRYSLANMVKRSRLAVSTLKKGLEFVLKKNSIDIIYGKAVFSDAGAVTIETGSGKEHLSFKKCLIACGSGPKGFDGADVDGDRILSSSDAIRMEELPSRVIIVGAGAIGVEFASFFSVLGSSVILAEMADSILPAEDKEVSRRLQSIFSQRGIEVLTRASLVSVSGEKRIEAVFRMDGGLTSREADKVILAAGRVPSTAGLGLGTIGVRTDEKGFISVDDKMMTSVTGIYAAGDVVKSAMLAHVAIAEGEIAALSAAGETVHGMDHSSVPSAVYSDIKVSSVGLTEDSAISNGMEYKVCKHFFKTNGRSVANNETEGFIKIIVDKKSRKLIGAHVIGAGADELINELALIKRSGLTVDDVKETVHAHPTVSEAISEVCKLA